MADVKTTKPRKVLTDFQKQRMTDQRKLKSNLEKAYKEELKKANAIYLRELAKSIYTMDATCIIKGIGSITGEVSLKINAFNEPTLEFHSSVFERAKKKTKTKKEAKD